ncbi:hypothetical protein [Roseivirga sp. UBA1976]|uniref:hypothetical protein n=1 Tax=Roseivirga sp. UBA1976 TaxID=1947386 RepID=UPI00257B4621|nr:hypothetical protein [Roseivirga sp. UBA1976]
MNSPLSLRRANRACTQASDHRFTYFLRGVLGIFSLMLISISTQAQEDNWTLLKESDGVKVFYQPEACQSQSVPDPLQAATIGFGHQTLKLKFVNSNSSNRSVTFSKVTKNSSNELHSLNLAPGTTLLDKCDEAPRIILNQQKDDDYPVAFSDYIKAFELTINN